MSHSINLQAPLRGMRLRSLTPTGRFKRGGALNVPTLLDLPTLAFVGPPLADARL